MDVGISDLWDREIRGAKALFGENATPKLGQLIL
jgi:hypothetical protein